MTNRPGSGGSGGGPLGPYGTFGSRRWQLAREAWGQATHPLAVLRRAKARAALNRRRQELARARRRTLARLLWEEGFDPAGDLTGAGTRALYRRYFLETGACRATFFRDLATFKMAGRFGRAAVAAITAGAEEDEKGPERSPHPNPSTATRPLPVGDPSDPSSAGPSVRLGLGGPRGPSPRLRRSRYGYTPCPACGRVRGLPARTGPPPVWYLRYLALWAAMQVALPRELREAVPVWEQRYLARLTTPRPRPDGNGDGTAPAPRRGTSPDPDHPPPHDRCPAPTARYRVPGALWRSPTHPCPCGLRSSSSPYRMVGHHEGIWETACCGPYGAPSRPGARAAEAPDAPHSPGS